MLKRVIGLSGLARSGKDTFYELLASHEMANHYTIKRFGLADSLKESLNPTIIKDYGFSIYSCTPAQKEQVRPLMVEFARDHRISTNGRYFLEKIDPLIRTFLEQSDRNIAVITDIRYANYTNDEAFWLKNELNGVLVHIEKYIFNDKGSKVLFEPPNADEALNDPKLRAAANYRISWPDVGLSSLVDKYNKLYDPHVSEFIKWFTR
jgi:hypothetical protein